MLTHSFLNPCIMLKSIFFSLAFYYNKSKMYTPLFNKENQPKAFLFIINYAVHSNCTEKCSFMEFFQIFNSLINVSLIC